MALVVFTPLPFIAAAGYYNIVMLEAYEGQLQKPLESASSFASENVDNIRVRSLQ